MSGTDPFFMPGTSVPLAGADATAAAPIGGAAGGGGSNIASSIGDWLSNNPGTLLGGSLLLGSSLFGNKPPPGLSTLQQQGAAESTFANQAMSAEQTGQLPPGGQALLDNLHHSMTTQIKSKYAALGLSGSTAEAQDLAQVPQQVAATQYQMINQLVSQGLSASGLAQTADIASMNAQVQQDERLQQAIAGFAGALAGGGRTAAAA